MNNSPNKVTLGQYLQFHKIQKQLKRRSKSKSKGKTNNFQTQQGQSMNNFFALIDAMSFGIKLDFQQGLQSNQPKEKQIFKLSNLLDKFVVRIKEEIRLIYKNIYFKYMAEHQQNGQPTSLQYFKNQQLQADLQVKKMHLADMVKEKFKNTEKQEKVIKAIFENHAQPQNHKQVEQKPEIQGKYDKEPAKEGFFQALLGLAKTASNIEQDRSNQRNNNHLRINSRQTDSKKTPKPTKRISSSKKLQT